MSDSCDLMDCSPPGSSVHGISQTRVLERVATSFSRGSFWSRNQTQSLQLQMDSPIAGGFFTDWATKEDVNMSLVVFSLACQSEEGPEFPWRNSMLFNVTYCRSPKHPILQLKDTSHTLQQTTQWPVTCKGGEAGQRGRPTNAHTWYQGIWGQWAVQWD